MIKVMKKPLSLILAFLICVGVLLGIPIPVNAAESGQVYFVAIPRYTDPIQDGWGHPAMSLINGWHAEEERLFEAKSMEGFTGNTAYCIEIGINLQHGDVLSVKGEEFWSEYPPELNDTIPPVVIKSYIGRIMQYGWTGQNDPTWSTNDPSDVEEMAEIIATQILIWETVIGERDISFNHVTVPSGINRVLDIIGYDHPLKSHIYRHYDRIVADVQNHSKIPSFCTRISSTANKYELTYNGSVYSATLTDTNNVLSNYNFTSGTAGVTFSVSGNKLTVNMKDAPTGAVNITAEKKNSQRYGVITWTDGITGQSNNGQLQDVVTYGEKVSDPVSGFFKLEASYGSAKIVKTSEDGKVSGITFTVSGNGINKTVTTNALGQMQIDNLKPGVYTVTEQNYDKYEPQESLQVTVVSGQTATVTFNNKLRRGDLTVTKTAEDGLTQGMKFHLYGTSLSGLPVNEYAIVDSDGKARFQGVLIGKNYTLEEVDTPDRYIVPEKQKADIEWNKVTGKSFDNELKRGDLTVTKTAEDGLTEGLRFHLYGTSYSGIAVDEYATVGADGKAYFEDILIGTGFTLEEVYVPDKYVVPAGQTAAIEWNKVTEKSFDNRLKKWNLTVKKADSETGTPQGDASLAGAVYGIYKGEKLIDRYTTDINGQFTTGYYLCGDEWSLREITPSEGYLIDASSYHIGAEAKKYTIEYNPISTAVDEEIIKGNIAIIKHTDDGSTKLETPEVGAEFEVYLKSSGSYEAAKDTEKDYLTCDENGFAQTKDLPYGVYTVHQTKGWDGREFLKDFDVYISNNGQTYRYLINNANFESYIKVIKTDAESGLTIPYAGAAFQLYDPNGNKIVMSYTYPEYTEIDTFYTTADGMLITPQKLEYGTGYSLVEVQAPYGYVLNSEPVYFDVAADTATEDGAVTVVKVSRPNMPQKGVIKITKTGEVFQSVVEQGSVYQPVYEIGKLSGAVFEICAAEDIYTLDGVLHYAKGDVVDTVTTGADGVAASKQLYLGKYEIQEITAPHSMVLNDEIQIVELTYAGQEVSVTEVSGSLYNERQKVKVSLDKTLEQNELFGIGNSNEIANIAFGLYAAENITAADGTILPADGLIEIVSFDTDGHAICQTDLPLGKYYLQERATDSHYILSDTKYPFEFAYAGQDVETVEIAVNDGKAIENKLKYGSVFGLKLDEDGNTIAGAKFGLFRNDENTYSEKNALLTAESAQDGTFRFDKIPVGTWVVRELVPAEGFVLNEQVYQVTVSEHEQVIEITLENRYIRSDIKGMKVDEDGKVIAGALFGLFENGTEEFTEETAFMTAESDETGVFLFEQIRYGNWIVKELRPAEGFVPNEKLYEVNVAEDGAVIEFTVDNKYIHGNIEGLKIDEDGETVEGAVFGLFTEDTDEFTEENAVMTTVSGADGKFLFENVRYGKWIVKELSCPKQYVLSDEVFEVTISEHGETITFTAVNKYVTGKVQAVKISSKDHTKLLSGAEFEIYLDANCNGMFEPDIDTLIGKLTESEAGFYEMDGLRYNGYFLFESKSPDGYQKDDRYFYFQISSDEETVAIENEKGVGFVNEPVPTPHQPGDPSSPQTGDNSHILLWIMLASGSLAMLVILSVAGRKRHINKN